MDEESLTKLREAVEAMILRQEQIFKLQEERLNLFLEKADAMTKTVELLELTNEALKQSLAENDAALDGLAKITAAQVQIVRPALKPASSAT